MNPSALELTVNFSRRLEYLHLTTGVSRLVCQAIREPELPGSFPDEVELAVSEACTNAIRHSGDTAEDARVVVSFRLDDARLVIEIRDQGEGFDMEDVPVPDFDHHPEGGYGLYIIRTVMDEVQYVRGEDFNTLTMQKYFKNKAGTP